MIRRRKSVANGLKPCNVLTIKSIKDRLRDMCKIIILILQKLKAIGIKYALKNHTQSQVATGLKYSHEFRV